MQQIKNVQNESFDLTMVAAARSIHVLRKLQLVG